MKRHERPRQSSIRVDLPFGKQWCELSTAERRVFICHQLKQLGPPSKQPIITCLCGKDVPTRFAYRCYVCGAFWCPKCGAKHFDIVQAKDENGILQRKRR